MEKNISQETMFKFLEGYDPEKYIVAIEYDKYTNIIYKIKQDPDKGKIIETDTLTSFMFLKDIKDLQRSKRFYYEKFQTEPNIAKLKSIMDSYGITIVKLRHDDHPRLSDGYKFKLICTQGHNKMMEFFRNGGISPYEQRNNTRDHFMILQPEEQYLISTGKRLFKGFDEYNQLHRFVFDLETTGLNPETCEIFLIGIKDTKGVQDVIEVDKNDPDGEAKAIFKFFYAIDQIKSSIISGYNSANFDWDFLFKRCEILGVDITKMAKTLKSNEKIYNRSSMVKIGSNTEDYQQTMMFGYNIIDINHATRRAQAIDSDMKNTKLKYVCKYNEIAKNNRVYIKGDQIGILWNDSQKYYFDNKTGSYNLTKPSIEFMDFITRDIVKNNPDKIFVFGDNLKREGYGGQAKEMRGERNTIGIVTKKSPGTNEEDYFSDTELDVNKKLINKDIANIISKIKLGKTIVFPKKGIGTGLAKLGEKAPLTHSFLIQQLKTLKLYVESFEEVTGKYIVERYLIDDLWETLEVDNVYNQTSFMLAKLIPTVYQRICTMGTAALWKMLMIAWSFENNLAIPSTEPPREKIVGGLSGLFKTGFCKNIKKVDFNSLYPSINLALDIFPSNDITGILRVLLKYFHSERFKAKNLSEKYKKSGDKQQSSFYKRKQLPLKIFINAFFGSESAPTSFPWAELDKGEQVTCSGRQFLRLAIKFFMLKGYTPVNLDTDGINLMCPEDEDQYVYVGKGLNDAVELGVEYKGLKALIAEFNDNYFRREMALGFDGEWETSISIGRKNYALLERSGKIKLTGNSFKSKKMPVYIEEFFDKELPLLLKGGGYDFVQHYYEYVEKIYNKQIPLSKLASKGKIKKTVNQYLKRGNDKNGKPLPAQAWMELIIQSDIKVNIGDTIYYVNCGTKASNGDVNKDENGKYYSKLIDAEEIENNPNVMGDYNVPKYIAAFNNKIKPILVIFSPDVRNNIIIKKPEDKKEWLIDELNLINGIPLKPSGQDSLEDLFIPEDREIKFWKNFDYNPDFWFEDEITFSLPDWGDPIKIN